MMIQIRQAALDDVGDIARLEQKCFKASWSEELIKKEIMSNSSFAVVAMDGDSLCGYAMFMLLYDEIHITKIAVDEFHRRLGIGNLLINALLKTAYKNNYFDITLEVRVSNKAAISLYEKKGFESVGVRKHYYTDNNEDALIMWLHMKEGNSNE